MIKQITFMVAIIALVIGLISIAWMILTAYKQAKKGLKYSLVSRILASLLIVIMVAGNFSIYRFNNVIDIYFNRIDMSAPDIAEARNAAKSVTEEIESEGIVLLKNDSNALPIQNNKVNVFGYSSLAFVYGGSGSGSADESNNIDFYTGLANAGIETNTQLKDFYVERLTEKSDVDIFHLSGGDYNIYEPAVSDYSQAVLDQAKAFSDTAVLVLSRSGGEGGDLPTDMADKIGGEAGKHYLELSQNESDLLDMIEKQFDKVVVIINAGNPMELGFLDHDQVDAALWVGNPGSTGANAIGKVLTGEVNPSGRLADTYAYDVTQNPAYYNSGDFQYKNTDSIVQTQWFDLDHYLYLDYQEGIYVGYRYFETRWIDNESNLCDEEAYHKAVQYPFGYGLSYTQFDQKLTQFSQDDTSVNVEVTVTNTGHTSGKDVVQLYNTPPYEVNGIEKSFVSLLAFDKTKVLEPGESQVLTFEIPLDAFASYDYQKIKASEGAYVLEAGSYALKLMANAHDLIDQKTFDISEDIIYDAANEGARPSDQVVAKNLFDSVSYGNDISYVSRADWENTDITQGPEWKLASQEIIDAIEKPVYPVNESDPEILVKDHQLTVDDLKGKAYDDPLWDQLLEQLSVDDMVQLTGFGGFSTAEIKSVGKYKTSDTDGPAGINGLVNGASGIQYTSAVTLASTWNPELAEKFGETMGKEAVAYGISGLYAPAMNLHRTAFGGRNFEYYSEDGILGGKIAAGLVRGINQQGIYCYIKHFALDNQETNRENVCVWASEQAMRELYFKAFEIAVKEGGARAVMDADCRIGTDWCGGSSELNNDLLRNEWGFKGMVITDYIGDNFKDADIALFNGCDLMLSTLGEKATTIVTGNTTGQQALRTASHNILYTIANTRAQELSKSSLGLWVYALIGLNIVLYVVIGMMLLGQKRRVK